MQGSQQYKALVLQVVARSKEELEVGDDFDTELLYISELSFGTP